MFRDLKHGGIGDPRLSDSASQEINARSGRALIISSADSAKNNAGESVLDRITFRMGKTADCWRYNVVANGLYAHQRAFRQFEAELSESKKRSPSLMLFRQGSYSLFRLQCTFHVEVLFVVCVVEVRQP